MQDYLTDKHCVHCHTADARVFEFHHVDPSTKLFEMGQSHCRNWKTVLEEINKCIILCANCHGIEHW